MTHPAGAVRAPSPWRWVFLVLTFAVTIVAYADRAFLAILKPVLDRQFGWSAADYGHMTLAFQLSVAGALLLAGWFMDRVGLRAGFAIGLGGWSLAAMAHVLARSVPQFIAARSVLGVFEAIGTPAGMKAITSFFAERERALVIGIGNIAPNLANVVGPLAITGLYLALGWQGAVLILGATGLACVALWLALPFRRMALQNPPDAAAPAAAAATPRHLPLALGLAKLCTDQAWWFMLFWLPDFLHHRFDLNMARLGAPVAAIYALAGLGAFAGGILPRLLRHSAASRIAGTPRFAAMALFAAMVAPLAFILRVHGLWPSVLVAGVALAGHQGFSTNIFAIAAERVPAARIGQVIGFAAFLGNVGGGLSVQAAAMLLQAHQPLSPMFAACALGYPLAWLVLRAEARHAGRA